MKLKLFLKIHHKKTTQREEITCVAWRLLKGKNEKQNAQLKGEVKRNKRYL